jgi:hypothetical protein
MCQKSKTEVPYEKGGKDSALFTLSVGDGRDFMVTGRAEPGGEFIR